MPINDYKKADKRIAFWNRIYRAALLTLVIFISVLAIIATQRVYAISRDLGTRTEDIQKQIECIGVYFTQDRRAELKITDINTCTIKRN